MIVVTAPPLVTLKVKLPADERRAAKRAAAREGVTMSDWGAQAIRERLAQDRAE